MDIVSVLRNQLSVQLFFYAVASVIELDRLLLGSVGNNSTTLHVAVGVEMLCHKKQPVSLRF
jgi:hypothetical protein